MTILIVDDQAARLEKTSSIIASLKPDAEILSFTDSLEALAKAREQEIDLAFLAPDMPELRGLDLGQYLIDLYPLINLIYLHDTSDFAYDAIIQHSRPVFKSGAGCHITRATGRCGIERTGSTQ